MRMLTSSARRLIPVATWLLVVLVLGLGVATVVPRLVGYQTYVITTGSMAGTADPGSLVLARTVPTASLQVGDVITYVPPPQVGITHPVTHRIVDVSTDEQGARTFQTKGDANRTADPWVFELDAPVQARMELAVPLAGWPVLLLADRVTRMLAIGGPALVVAVIALTELVRGVWSARRVEEADIIRPETTPAAAAPATEPEAPSLVGSP
jgi:signal peptidase I